MARQPRVEYEGAFYHVTSRGFGIGFWWMLLFTRRLEDKKVRRWEEQKVRR
jgi:hypothetical protein